MLAGSVAWAGPTNTGHQQQVSGVAAHPHSRTTGRGTPAGQEACIYHQEEAERSSFASGRILVTAYTHIAAAPSLWWTTLLSQYRAIVVWGEDAPQVSGGAAWVQTSALPLTTCVTTVGGLDSRGLQVLISEMRAKKTHTLPSSCKVKEVIHVQPFKYCEYSTEVSTGHLGVLAFVFSMSHY